MSNLTSYGSQQQAYLPAKAYRYKKVSLVNEDAPVNRNEFKLWAKIRGTKNDIFIEDVLKMVQELAEADTRRTIQETQFTTFRDSFYWTSGQVIAIQLKRTPFVSLSSITYSNSAGGTTTVDAGTYYVEDVEPFAYVWPQENQNWPTSDIVRQNQAITITFNAGYGSGCQLPLPLKIGMMQHALDIIENKRGDCSCASKGTCCEAHSMSYEPFRIYENGRM